MIVPDPEAPGGERAKVLDFGIAKVLASAQGHNGDPMEMSAPTRTGMMVGTPLYMAPEQCRGGGVVDDKADVYSLGVMLYRMLCGRPPFIAEGSGAVMAMHIYEPPPPLRQFEPGIPEDLAALVHRLLAKDPIQRPAMSVVAHQLEQLKAIHGTGHLSTTDIGLTTSQAYLQHPKTPMPVGTSAAGLNPLNNTLAQSAAQAQIVPTRRGPLIAVMTIGGSLVLAAGIVFGVVMNRSDRDHRSATMTQVVAPARPVKWTVSSDPPGATVLRALDQTEVGRTPWVTSQPATNGQLILILRRSGYADRVVTIDQGGSAYIKETLQPLVINAPPPLLPPEPATPVPGTKRKKGGKPGKPGVAAEGTPAVADKPAAPASTPTVTTPKPKDETSNGRIQVVD